MKSLKQKILAAKIEYHWWCIGGLRRKKNEKKNKKTASKIDTVNLIYSLNILLYFCILILLSANICSAHSCNVSTVTEIFSSLFGTDEAECPFQIASLNNAQEDTADEKAQMLDCIVKAVNRLNASAVIKENGVLFDINLSFEPFESEYDITVSPLLSNKTAPLSEKILFSSMELTQLSEFYKISVSDGKQTVSRVIMIPTENMPSDREKAVVSSVVNDKSCFYRYIAFLLGDNLVISALESNDSNDEVTGTTKANKAIQLPALYEKMLRTAATAPERFKEIEYLIKSVSADGVIPGGFEELYNTFRKVVKM